MKERDKKDSLLMTVFVWLFSLVIGGVLGGVVGLYAYVETAKYDDSLTQVMIPIIAGAVIGLISSAIFVFRIGKEIDGGR